MRSTEEDRRSLAVGFFYGLLDTIEKRVKVKHYLPKLQRHVHGRRVEGDKVAVVEDSVVSRSRVGDGE